MTTIPDTLDCKQVQLGGGKVPSTADLFDPSKRILEVNGSSTCREVKEGSMREFDYEWTLVFCRITDGEPAC